MEPLWDNLKFIQNQYSESDKEYSKITEMVQNEKLVITPLAYIRGRSLSNICFIVDEAQNLTPHEVKTIITVLERIPRSFSPATSTRSIPLTSIRRVTAYRT